MFVFKLMFSFQLLDLIFVLFIAENVGIRLLFSKNISIIFMMYIWFFLLEIKQNLDIVFKFLAL